MTNTDSPQIRAIVPAAGSGQRMQSGAPKQYLEIGGQCILQHSLDSLLTDERIVQIVVCVAENDTQWSTLKAFDDPRVVKTLGGETRAQSVQNGLRTLAPVCQPDDWVMVHDAARPFLSQAQLDNLVKALSGHPVGGLLAVPATDTLKQAADDGCTVKCTIDRASVWLAQTPQMFRFDVLNTALQRAVQQGVLITDEASAVEAAGHAPLLVQGDAINFKLTTPQDLRLAEAILALS